LEIYVIFSEWRVEVAARLPFISGKHTRISWKILFKEFEPFSSAVANSYPTKLYVTPSLSAHLPLFLIIKHPPLVSRRATKVNSA